MTTFNHALRAYLRKSAIRPSHRYISTAQCYEGKEDPAPIFIKKDVQNLLKSLTRVDYDRVFRKRKLGSKTLSDPTYKFMTEEELQEYMEETRRKAEKLLQIPPVLRVRTPDTNVLSKDPALKGLETSRFVFTDITYGVRDSNRLVVVREPDGTLQEAEWTLRQRVNQTYFPQVGKVIEPPKMFEGEQLQNLLDKQEYEYILDRACLQFEPDDPVYQKIVSIVYQHVNDNNNFELLRSTRHFGALTFFLVWNKYIDNLLVDLIETLHIDEAKDLVILYQLVHSEVKFEGASSVEVVQDYIKKAATKKGVLELAVQAYKEVAAKKETLDKGIRAAHGNVD